MAKMGPYQRNPESSLEDFPFSTCENPFSVSDWITIPCAPTLAHASPVPVHFRKRNAVFHNFANLPAEIRVQIWELALPGPHVLHVCFKRMRSAEGRRSNGWVLANGMKKISALQTCQESRAEAFKAGYLQIRLLGEGRWFNVKKDTMFWNMDICTRLNKTSRDHKVCIARSITMGVRPLRGYTLKELSKLSPDWRHPPIPHGRPPISGPIFKKVQNLAIDHFLCMQHVKPQWLVDRDRTTTLKIVLEGFRIFDHSAGAGKTDIKFVEPFYPNYADHRERELGFQGMRMMEELGYKIKHSYRIKMVDVEGNLWYSKQSGFG